MLKVKNKFSGAEIEMDEDHFNKLDEVNRKNWQVINRGQTATNTVAVDNTAADPKKSTPATKTANIGGTIPAEKKQPDVE